MEEPVRQKWKEMKLYLGTQRCAVFRTAAGFFTLFQEAVSLKIEIQWRK